MSDRDYLEGFLAGDKEEAADQTAAPQATEGDAELQRRVIACIQEIYDPEIPVNIYDLGLIYDVSAEADGAVVITMTLTTPHCPVAETMPAEVESRARQVAGVTTVQVNLVWDPPWDPSKMTEEAQLELGLI